MGVHALRGTAAAGRAGGSEERGRHVLYELRVTTTVLRASCTGRAPNSTGYARTVTNSFILDPINHI